MSGKKRICVDFDGVLHKYTSGWKGADVIPDGDVPGAADFLVEASKEFVVSIHSSRSQDPAGLRAMKRWICALLERRAPVEARDVFEHLEFPTQKPPAIVYIDDRAWRFDGVFPNPTELADFQPWNVSVSGAYRIHGFDFISGINVDAEGYVIDIPDSLPTLRDMPFHEIKSMCAHKGWRLERL